MTNNPLAGHFRVPALHLELPSKGEWYTEGSLEMPESQEVEVFPMTAKDDILLQTPDALMNGTATSTVIESCIPSIKDGMSVPSVDLDAILISIRIATYGNEMDISASCPECKETSDYVIDMSTILGKITVPDFSIPIKANGLTLYLKPQTYRTINMRNLERFEEQRTILVARNSDMTDEDKLSKFNDIMVKIANITVEQLSDSIKYILTEAGDEVYDVAFIKEFLNNCDKTVYDAIKLKTTEFKKQADDITHMDVTCTHCEHKHGTEISLEYSNFFG